MEDYGDHVKRMERKTAASKYSYTFGDLYPGYHIGHNQCAVLQKGLPVPARMGWLWNVHENILGLKYRRGWKPGAVGKTIANMMTFKTIGNENKSLKDKKKKKTIARLDLEEHELPLDPKPALKVQRKGDVFTIQVNPLKDSTEITPCDNPYVDCNPVVFKIIKKRSPEELAKLEARRMVRLKKQRDAKIRRALVEATEDICKCAYMDVFCNNLGAIDSVIEACPAFIEPACICKDESNSSLSSNASWDIEYTPPFGCIGLATKKKKAGIHVDTQYIATDAGIENKKMFQSKDSLKLKRQKKANRLAE